jgi:NAD-reducing hydrogenase small subunit
VPRGLRTALPFNPEGRIPDDPEIPMLLDKVYPAQEVVRIDYHIPGCPPSADTLWKTLTALLGGTSAELPYELIKYD